MRNSRTSPLDELKHADEEAARRFSGPGDRGIGRIGLILTSDLKNGGYACTPVNTVAFAFTGGEGVHFSFLHDESELNDDSPIIVTIPQAFGTENFVVGENLYEFLCLGIHRGYFALEQLGYSYDETVEVYANTAWEPKTKHHEWVGFGVDDEKRAILRFLAEQFGLVPWTNVKKRLAALAAKYKGRLTMPEAYPF